MLKSVPIMLQRPVLFFSSDGVAVGVINRNVERYDLVKIKPTESVAEHPF